MQDFQERQRVLRACVACRRSRRKCSGIHPCNNCDSRGEYCEYEPAKKRGPPPKLRSSSYASSNEVYSASSASAYPSTSTYGYGGRSGRTDSLTMGGSPHFSGMNPQDYHASNGDHVYSSNYDNNSSTLDGTTNHRDTVPGSHETATDTDPSLLHPHTAHHHHHYSHPYASYGSSNDYSSSAYLPSEPMRNTNGKKVTTNTATTIVSSSSSSSSPRSKPTTNRKRSRQQITVSTSNGYTASTVGGGPDSPHNHHYLPQYNPTFHHHPDSSMVSNTDMYSYYDGTMTPNSNDILTSDEEIYVQYYLQNSHVCIPVVDTVYLTNLVNNGSTNGTETYSTQRLFVLTVIAMGAGMKGYKDIMLHYYYTAREYLDFQNMLMHPSPSSVSALLLLAILTNHIVKNKLVTASPDPSNSTNTITLNAIPIYINFAHSLANTVTDLNPSVRVSLSLLFFTWSSLAFASVNSVLSDGIVNSWKNPPVPKKLFTLTKDNLLDRFTALVWYTVVTLGNLHTVSNSGSTLSSSSSFSSLNWNDLTVYLDELSTLSISNNVFTHIPWNYLALQCRILAAVTTQTETSLDLGTVEHLYTEFVKEYTTTNHVCCSTSLLSFLVHQVYVTLSNYPQSILNNTLLSKVRSYVENYGNEDNNNTGNVLTNTFTVPELYTQFLGSLTVPYLHGNGTLDTESTEEISKASYQYSGTVSSLDSEDDDREPVSTMDEETETQVPKKRIVMKHPSGRLTKTTATTETNGLSSTLGSVAALFLLADASSEEENDQSSTTITPSAASVRTEDPYPIAPVSTTSIISGNKATDVFSLPPPKGSSDTSRSVSYEQLAIEGMKKKVSSQIRGSSPALSAASSIISSKHSVTSVVPIVAEKSI